MIRATVAAAALALALAGCGADDVSEQVDPVAEAADKTLAAGGAKMSGGGTFKSQGIEVELSLTGAVDFEESRARYEMDFADIEGAGAAVEDKARKAAGLPMTIIQDDTTGWITTPQVARKLPDGKEWIKIDLEQASEEALPGLDTLAQANESNPAAMLRFLKTTGGAKKTGTETIRGVKTTKYRATVDLRKAVELVPEDERAAMRKTIDRVAKEQGGYTFDMEVFIDEDGLIRRERAVLDQKFEGERVTGGLVIDLHDFGKGVEVEAPPEDETEDVTDELEAAAG